jgi:hypothetical protein
LKPERASRLKVKIKRTLIALAAVLVGAFVLLNVLAYRHAHAMMHFTDRNARTREPGELTLAQKLKVLVAGVNMTRDGRQLNGVKPPLTRFWPRVRLNRCRVRTP